MDLGALRFERAVAPSEGLELARAMGEQEHVGGHRVEKGGVVGHHDHLKGRHRKKERTREGRSDELDSLPGPLTIHVGILFEKEGRGTMVSEAVWR